MKRQEVEDGKDLKGRYIKSLARVAGSDAILSGEAKSVTRIEVRIK